MEITTSSKDMHTEDCAIRVTGVSKTFKIPHEKINSIRGAAINLFRSGGYEEFKALDDVSFEVKKGEFFGIIGRNGSGKSTLLKILAGIYQADKGKSEVKGLISPFLELGIGFTPELSGRDNIYLNATVLGLTRKQIDEKFNSIVAFSELERFIDQKLKNYSSGMQVRLAFAVSIHANREILLMDEVLAVGDNNFQSKCLREFTKYRNLGKTVVLVTHDIGKVQRYCDRAMLLRNGKMMKIGKPESIVEEYLFENMTDEEKRLALKKKKNAEVSFKKIKKFDERWGTQDVIFEKVELLDRNGNKKMVFETAEPIILRMHYALKKEIESAVFGIEIFNDAGYRLFGFNTGMLKKNIQINKNGGYVDFELDNMSLLGGIYSITTAIANDNCSIQFDYWKNAIEFMIVRQKNKTDYMGDLNIDIKINGEEI